MGDFTLCSVVLYILNKLMQLAIKINTKFFKIMSILRAKINEASIRFEFPTPFLNIKHVKTNNLIIDDIEQKLAQHPEPKRARAFMQVFKPIYQAYQTHLTDNQEIDFEDLVHRACGYIDSKRYQSPYKYLMVDEYQDASQDRIRLVSGLLLKNYLKLTALKRMTKGMSPSFKQVTNAPFAKLERCF